MCATMQDFSKAASVFEDVSAFVCPFLTVWFVLLLLGMCVRIAYNNRSNASSVNSDYGSTPYTLTTPLTLCCTSISDLDSCTLHVCKCIHVQGTMHKVYFGGVV